MSHPTIMPLPQAPSRVGDPNNFLTESDVWLSRQSTFRTQSNALSSYLNNLGLDLFNWGTLADTVNPPAISVTLLPELAILGEPGIDFANKTDSVFSAAEMFSYDQLQVADLLDLINLEFGGTFFADPDRPIVGSLSANPLRSDTPSEFESKSMSYYQSFKSYAESVKALNDYAYKNAYQDEDFGLITEAVTETFDFGLL